MEIKTQITINATPDKIWRILTETANYPSWNPFIKSIEGELKVGNTIEATIAPPGAKAMKFKPFILVMDKNKELKWLGKLLFKGLFDGEHKFEIKAMENGTVIFKQSEIFRGILVPLFKNKLKNNTKNGFELMNEQLKEMAETV